ncbi:hypothetical protein CLOP_g23587, partial [Closterium sp. NIES-67]
LSPACWPNQVEATWSLRAMSHDDHSRRNQTPVHLGPRSPAWYPYGDHHGQRPEIHLVLLARHVGPIRHSPTVLICLSPANRRSDRTDKSDHGTVDSHELPGYQQVGRFATHAGVFLQQCTLLHDQSLALFPELWDRSDSTHFHQRQKPK